MVSGFWFRSVRQGSLSFALLWRLTGLVRAGVEGGIW